MSRFRFYTGSYTDADLFPGSRGEGIQLWELEAASGSLEPLSAFSGVSNPSWVAVDPEGRFMAAASEHVGGASRTCLLQIGPDGSLTLSDTVSSGDATCHVAFSPDGRFVASAAYVAGEVQLIRVDEGAFTGRAQVHPYDGSGPDPDRQEAPHAHQAVFSPDGALLHVTDLGSDRIWSHRIGNGLLHVPAFSLSLPPGEGPRHVAFDWKRSLGLVVGELTGHVHLFTVEAEAGVFTLLHSLSSLPEDWQKAPSSAAIRMHPGRPFVYVSNRNGGLLSTFRVDVDRRRLQRVDIRQLQDPSPRDFHVSPDGRWLIVAGQESHRLYVHPIDSETGRIGPVRFEAACPSPVCLAWLPA